jgi:hypothetical protein
MIDTMRARQWLLALAVVAASAGCGLGDGTGSLSGTLFVRGCTDDHDFGAMGAPAAYNMHPHFFVADPINALASSRPLHPINKLNVRVQPTGTAVAEADLLFVNVADDAQVAVGGATTVGATTNVRATLTLNETCPSAEVQVELDGTLTFTSFGGANVASDGIQFGDRLAATFDFDIIDRRAIAIGGIGAVPTTPATSGHISGNFDFIVHQGKAAQPW